MRIYLPSVFLILLIIIAFVPSAHPQDEDSTMVNEDLEEEKGPAAEATLPSVEEEGAEIDTLRTTILQEPRRHKGESEAFDSWWLLDLKPKTTVSISKDKEVTNWKATLDLNRMLTNKVTVNMGASITTKENTFLNRSDSNNGTSLSVKYTPVPPINFTVGYNATLIAHRLDLAASPDERRKSEGITLSGEFKKQLTDALTVTVKAGGGYSENTSPRVSNTGKDQDISASLNFKPSGDLNISASYDGKGRKADSKVDSSGVVLLSSRDRARSDNLSLNAVYTVLRGIKMTMDASQRKGSRQYPDPKWNQQESEEQDGSSASFKCAFDLFKRITWDLGVYLSRSRKIFILNKDREFSSNDAKISGKLKATPWRSTTINFNGEYKTGRSEYQTDETGDGIEKSIAFKLSQGLGSKANLALSGISSLSSIFYDDKEKNPKDRDRLSNSVTMVLNYGPTEKIATRLGYDYSGEKLIYVKSASSGSNRTTRKHRLSGSYTVKRFLGMRFSQDYDINAIYTDYHFDPSKNNLIRNSNVRTQINFQLTDGLGLNLSHNYKFQDQGSYRKEDGKKRYSRSSESEWHSIDIGLQYRLGEKVKFSAGNGYILQRIWTIKGGEKRLDYQNPRSELASKIDLSYDVGRGTKMTLKVGQKFQEGKTVNKAFRKYIDVEFEVSHVF
ncbi:MAG: hypothetical protein ACUVUU_04120 [bacterium]